MSGHVHAELMAQYAEDARETEKPWERWELYLYSPSSSPGRWVAMQCHPTWSPSQRYRRKPKTSWERFEAFCEEKCCEPTSIKWEIWAESARQQRELDK